MPKVDPTTEELRRLQLEREKGERAAAEQADDDTAEHHVARADKAAYLRRKLEERARAEREKG